MKKSTVKNLTIGTIALLGISYVVESQIKTKKRNLEIQKSKERNELEELVNNNTIRSYHTLGNVVMENGKPTVKELEKVI